MYVYKFRTIEVTWVLLRWPGYKRVVLFFPQHVICGKQCPKEPINGVFPMRRSEYWSVTWRLSNLNLSDPPLHNCNWIPCQKIMNTKTLSIQHKEKPLSSNTYMNLQTHIFGFNTFHIIYLIHGDYYSLNQIIQHLVLKCLFTRGIKPRNLLHSLMVQAFNFWYLLQRPHHCIAA